MQALVVWADPSPNSLTQQLGTAAANALTQAGHHVDVLDLYHSGSDQSGFDPVMKLPEWQAYRRHAPALDDVTTPHAELVRNAEILVFVYPTRWCGLPAILKGWLERVFVPGVAFALNEETDRIEGRLGNVRRLIGIATYREPRWRVALSGDPGRRTILRTLRLVCPRSSRSSWFALYSSERRSAQQRAQFISNVRMALGGKP